MCVLQGWIRDGQDYVLLSFLSAIWLVSSGTIMKKRLRKLRRKYGSAWRDILLVFSIQVSFAQIGGSMPNLLEVEWPGIYLQWLLHLQFLQFDVISIIGGACLGGIRYEHRFVATACIVIIIIGSVGISYSMRLWSLRKSLKNSGAEGQQDFLSAAAQNLFSVVDTDQSGVIDESELALICGYLSDASDKDKKSTVVQIPTSVRQLHEQHLRRAQSIIRELSGTSRVLTESSFVKAVQEGYLAQGTNNDHSSGVASKGSTFSWIYRVQKARLRSSHASIVVQLLLLVHAPVSQKVFLYFNGHNLGGQWHLRQDYTLVMFRTRWNTFLPIVITVGICFTLALPVGVLITLWSNRKVLYTPEIKSRLGFMYARFNKGAELWEVHEIFRKSILCGALVYLPPTSRSALAILVCVLAVACLNMFEPPRNRNVFWVAEAAFLSTTFKYIGVVLMNVATDEQEKNIIGTTLIVVDILVMVGGLAASVLIIINLKRSYPVPRWCSKHSDIAAQSETTTPFDIGWHAHGSSA